MRIFLPAVRLSPSRSRAFRTPRPSCVRAVEALASPGRRRHFSLRSYPFAVFPFAGCNKEPSRLLRWIAWHCTHHRDPSGMQGSSIAPFDFSRPAASSVRSRLVFCRAPGAFEVKAGDIRLTASSLRGLRHCSRVRLGPGPRSFQRLRKENLAAPAQSSCRCAADGVGAKAGTLTHLGCVPWRGSAGKSAGKVAKARISSPSRMNLVAIIQQSVPCRDRLRFVRSKPRSARPPSPICLRKSPAVARGALYGTLARRCAARQPFHAAAKPGCPDRSPEEGPRSAQPGFACGRAHAPGRKPIGPGLFFDRTEDDAGMPADRFGLLKGPF